MNNWIFPESCIEELIHEFNSENKAKSIEDDYAVLLYVVLHVEEWKKYCSKLCLCERSIASKVSSCKIKI